MINKRNKIIVEDGSTDSTPSITISGESEKMGIIQGMNLAASSAFGYNKTELISTSNFI
jgi:hypothetical protein